MAKKNLDDVWDKVSSLLEKKIEHFQFNDWIQIKNGYLSEYSYDLGYITKEKEYNFSLLEHSIEGTDMAGDSSYSSYYYLVICKGKKEFFSFCEEDGYEVEDFYHAINKKFDEREQMKKEKETKQKRRNIQKIEEAKEEKFLKDMMSK